jgi:hypothetical protein
MGIKVFVSYKHGDNSVQRLTRYGNSTARDYVDYLSENTLKNDVYKGEYNEDLSAFKDDTIKNRLKDKIHDSSVTLVLISPNMKDSYKNESDQWIPWEISYSLKEIMRNDKTSHTNGILAVILPDCNGSYSYFIQDGTCKCCNSKTIKTDTLFRILEKNMFNAKVLNPSNCPYCKSYSEGKSSYIEQVKWCDFISNKDFYLDSKIAAANIAILQPLIKKELFARRLITPCVISKCLTTCSLSSIIKPLLLYCKIFYRLVCSPFYLNVINRLANNSFLIKGWSMAILAAAILFIARSNSIYSEYLILTFLIPIFGFWLLDGYFLWQERLFRGIYDDVRQQETTDFKMNVPAQFKKANNKWRDSVYSLTLGIFYSVEIVFIVTVFFVFKGC